MKSSHQACPNLPLIVRLINSAGEIKIWSSNIEEKQLKQIASGNIDCRPTCLGLLDTKQFGKPSQTQRNADSAKQQVQKPQQQPQTSKQDDAELELLKPRTFVSIEYDGDVKDAQLNASDDEDDDDDDASSNDDDAKKVKPKSKSKKNKSKAAAAAPDSSNSEDDLASDDDSEEEEDSEIESHSDSESESERRPRPKQKANKRKAPANNKSRAKQAKKK